MGPAMNVFRKKIVVWSVICSLVILTLAAINYRLARHVVEKTVITQQEDLVAKAVNTVEIWLGQQMKILNAAADSISLENLVQDVPTMLSLQMAMKAGHFTDVYIGTKSGQLIDGAKWQPPPDYDPRHRPWYQRAKDLREVGFTTPYTDLVTNELVIALVKPLYDAGQLVGVMGADTVLDSLVRNVLNFKLSTAGYSFIVEKSGTIIVHPQKEYVMRSRLQNIEPDLIDEVNQFQQKKVGSVTYRDTSGILNILSFKQIAGSDWFLCITVPRDEAYSLTRKTTIIFAMEIVLRILLILSLIVLLGFGGSVGVLFLFNKRYRNVVQQHQQQLSGISKDLEWNRNKREEVEIYYKTLFNVANDAILINDSAAFVECNHKAEEMFGFSRIELLSKSLIELSPSHQPDGSRSEEKLAVLLQGIKKGEQNVFRWSFLRKDGIEFPASVSLTTFRLQDRDLVLSIIRDISNRIAAEGQLMQAQKMAAAGEMLGAIAHQWRQPLNTLSTYISSLQAAFYNGMLSKDLVEKAVSGAGDQITFMSKTIDDFRNFFKPSKTKGPIDILEAVINAVKLMEAQIRHSSIKLTVHNKTKANSLIVFGYQGEFIHVLVNILANARDAIVEADKISQNRLRTITIVISKNDEQAILQIIDSGCGIPEHLLPKIFNPYYTTKGTSSGSGMGLYMSKMIVEKEMGGILTAENTADGACFTIRLNLLHNQG